jgi:hypothetical protein
MEFFAKLNDAYLKLQEELENDNLDVEQDVFDLEEKVKESIEFAHGYDLLNMKMLLINIKSLKKEFDLYDEEGESDMMFPNRHDENFDNDSMNPDNVFWED